MQLPALLKLGFRFRWRLELGNPRLHELWSLMWPSVIAGAAVQVNVVVNGMFASEFDGGRSWLNCAFRLMQFPIGLFGVSLATVTLPSVARKFAQDGLAGAFRYTVRSSMRLRHCFSAHSGGGGVWHCAGRSRIIGLIYQHGHFSARDTSQTALVLQAYAVGLAGYAAIKVLTPCFYALNLPRTPLRISLVAIGVNLALNLANANVFGLGVAGLAMANSLASRWPISASFAQR